MGEKLKPVAPPAKGDAFSKIVKFLAGTDAVVLTTDEETILNRWMFADAMFRQHRGQDEIITALQNQFSVSEFTAIKDIKQAQKLFATAREINKKYLGHLHLDRINKDIEHTRERLFFEESDELPGIKKSRVPDAKELAALAKLHDVYSSTLHSLPDAENKEVLPPPVFVFNVLKGQEINTGMDLTEAMEAADRLLTAPASSVQDLDFDEINEDPTDEPE